MAASNISITQGSGTRLATNSYTEGAVTVHDEKTILGEQYLPSYVGSTIGSVSSTATINSHLLQVMAGASLRVRIRRIEVHQYTVATTASLLGLSLYRLTTAGTGGVAHGINVLDPADGAVGATLMTLPTAKGTEGVIVGNRNPYLMQTLAASSPLPDPICVWDFSGPRSKPLIIAAGTTNGIAVKNLNAVAGANVFFSIWLDESSF